MRMNRLIFSISSAALLLWMFSGCEKSLESDFNRGQLLSTGKDIILNNNLLAKISASYVTGDFHQHSTYTDGAYSIGHMMSKNYQYGLDWWANSEHGGGWSRNGRISGLDLNKTVYWDEDPGVTILGTISTSGGHQNMWRWQALRDYSFFDILSARTTYRSKTIIQGYEMNVPGHEHGSVGIITGQFGANPKVNAIAEFEFKFDDSDIDLTGGVSQGWTKSTLSGHAKTLEAINWLQNKHRYTSWLIPAHPERRKLYTIADFRDMNNAGPDVCFGFESMPGHQKESGRGGYGSGADGGGTFGGTGYYAAKVGGLWDAMLSEGRHWWLFASSDFHNEGGDFYPGEYQKTYTSVRNKKSAQEIVNGLCSGNSWVVEGDLIDCLDFRIHGKTMGETAVVNGNNVLINIYVHDPSGSNNNTYSTYTEPDLDHIDLIAGKINGKIAPGDPEYSNSDATSTTKLVARFDAVGGIEDSEGLVSRKWQELGNGLIMITYLYKGLDGDMYFRLRGTNQGLNVPNETDGAGNPLPDNLMGPNDAAKAFADLWFYSNPIFVRK